MLCDVRPMENMDVDKVFKHMVDRRYHIDTNFQSNYAIFERDEKKLVVYFHKNPCKSFRLEFYTGVRNIRFDSVEVKYTSMLNKLNELLSEGVGTSVEDIVKL